MLFGKTTLYHEEKISSNLKTLIFVFKFVLHVIFSKTTLHLTDFFEAL